MSSIWRRPCPRAVDVSSLYLEHDLVKQRDYYIITVENTIMHNTIMHKSHDVELLVVMELVPI